ncbi:MAG: GLUG motif-containing protein, partial [Bacilli bacterium]
MIPSLPRRLALALLLCLALVAGASADPFSVATYADLCKVGTGADGWFLNASYVQTADIQCPAGENFPRVGLNPGTPFAGTYDGNGYEIRDLNMNYPDSQTGMFITLGATGKLYDIVLVDAIVSSLSPCGALVGVSSGLISGCHVSGTITGSDIAGGLVGTVLAGDLICCTSTCTILCEERGGGLIGCLSGGTVYTCSATGNVSGHANLGGLIGDMSHVSDLYSSGMVSHSSATGSVSGLESSSPGYHVGGLVGRMTGGTLETSYATGNVGAGTYVGGLVGSAYGEMGTIRNCYATGDALAVVTAPPPPWVGGLLGNCDGSVIACYSTGQVSAPNAVGTFATYCGGLIGEIHGSATASYWDIETSGRATSAAGTGKTTAEMKTLATFADWDIATPIDYTDEVWYLVPGEDYPRLAWEGVPTV